MNPLYEIAQKTAKYEQFSADLPHSEKIKLRNDIIIMLYSTGISKDSLQDHFKISRRRLDEILQEAEMEVTQWFHNLPKKTMLAIFRNNCLDVFDEISRLKNLRNKSSDDSQEFEMTVHIIDSIIKYDRMVAEGPTLISQKETTEQAEKIIKEANNGTYQD